MRMNEQQTGARIAQARKEKGWTQKELAERVHVSIAAVSKWERGLNYPDLSLLQPLAEVLGISAAEILGLENETAAKAVQTVSELSTEEKTRNKQRQKKGLLYLLFCLLAGLAVCTVIVIIGSSDNMIPSFGFMEMLFHSGLLNLVAIALGLCAWTFGILSVLSDKQQFSVFSFLFCALCVYLPTLITDLQVRFGDFAALEDTIWGYDFAALTVLTGTLLLFVCSIFLNKKKKNK